MIVFDLDGTLANASHRQHFVDATKNPDYSPAREPAPIDVIPKLQKDRRRFRNKITGKEFKPDWRAFYDACDKDELIWPVFEILCLFIDADLDVSIWSGRCESVRNKTMQWLRENILFDKISDRMTVKMRPIGDSTPDDELKMRWLDEAIAEGKTIEYVFDDCQKVIRMWRRRGIFVFNCAQHEEEF